MKTMGEIVAEVQGYLRSFVRDQEISTHLAASILDDERSISVADASIVSRGRIEIGDELIWVDRVDKTDNKLSIPPYGRGMDGTAAAGHVAGDRVIMSPLYPRKLLKDTINQTIAQIGSQLYATEQLSIPIYTSNDFKFKLPSNVVDVLTVTISDARYNFTDVVYLRDWTFDKNAPVSIASTGKAIYLYDGWFDGWFNGWLAAPSALTVTVTKDPTLLSADTDLWSTTGLPDSAVDIPVLGAASRLLATSDAYNIQTRAVDANTLDSKVSSSAAQQQSKYLQALFLQRLDEERLRLLNANNNRSRYQR